MTIYYTHNICCFAETALELSPSPPTTVTQVPNPRKDALQTYEG